MRRHGPEYRFRSLSPKRLLQQNLRPPHTLGGLTINAIPIQCIVTYGIIDMHLLQDVPDVTVARDCHQSVRHRLVVNE